MRDCQQAAQTSRLAFCVRDTQGAQQSGLGRTERKRSPEQPGPQGNAQMQFHERCFAKSNVFLMRGIFLGGKIVQTLSGKSEARDK